MDQARILIIDDDAITRKNFTRLLQKEGFHVAVADTGSRGLERLLESSYDLVMTDLMMEDIDGLELLTRIKNQFSSGSATALPMVKARGRKVFFKASYSLTRLFRY